MATARPLDPIDLGVDIGNATTCAAKADGVAAFFPSVLTTMVGRYDGMSKVAGTTRHHIDYGEIHAVVGADALEMHGHDTILNETAPLHVRYTEDASLLCFLAGVAAAFPTADTVGIRLATGAPLSIFESHGSEIAARYQGAHQFSYNGHRRTVVVDRVHVFGEGREAWRLLTEKQRMGNVAVHDLGGRTWNVLLFKDGAYSARRTFDFGIERLLDFVPAAPKDAASRWALLGEMRKDAKAHPRVRVALEQAIVSVLPQIERKVPLSQAHRHALMGGGAPFLPAILQKRYSAPTIVLNGDKPEAANAIAYAKALAEVA